MYYGLFTLPDTNSTIDPGTDIFVPKMGTVVIRDLDSDRNPNLSLCNGNSFCTDIVFGI